MLFYRAFSYVPYFNQQNRIIKINKTDNKTHFMLGTNTYMFRHQGSILREFIKNKVMVSQTRISGVSRRHFQYKN